VENDLTDFVAVRTMDRLGPRMCSVGECADRHTLRGNFWGGYVAAHCNQWGISGIGVQEHVKQSSCRLGE